MALRFYWGFDGNSDTLTAADYTIGDDSTATKTATYDASADKTGGGYGLLCNAASENAYFSTSSGTVPADRTVGSIGFWGKWDTFPTNGLSVGFRFISATTARRIEMVWLTGNQIRLRIGSSATGDQVLDTSSLSLSTGTWYFFVLRWDQPNSNRAIEVYDASGNVVSGGVTSTAGFTAPEDLIGGNGIMLGNISSSPATMYFDNYILSNVYDANLVYNRNITDQADYNEAGGAAKQMRNYQTQVWG